MGDPLRQSSKLAHFQVEDSSVSETHILVPPLLILTDPPFSILMKGLFPRVAPFP